MSRDCGHCHAQASDLHRFCTQCGRPVPSEAAGQDAEGSPHGSQSPGDRRVVTVLFADISGFTRMSEQLDPTQVAAIVNGMFAVLTEPIYRFGGIVDKYIGDAIMALFGAPVAHEDDPERAVWAAFEMQRAALAYGEEIAARHGIPLRVRVGLHTGLVVTGSVGGQQRRDYTVIGGAVRVAQHMEGQARTGKVLVSHATYRLAQHRFDFEPRQTCQMTDAAPMATFELLGPREPSAETGVAETANGRPAPRLVELLEAWAETRRGVPQLVTLVGDAGMGKSHLANQFLRHREVPARRRVIGRCQSYAQNAPFSLVLGILHQLIGTSAHHAASAIRSELAAFCHANVSEDVERVEALFGWFLGITEERELSGLSAEQRRNLVLAELQAVLSQWGRNQGFVLAIEDLQWADAASLRWLNDWLEGLAKEKEPLSVLVLLQYRSDASWSPDPAWGIRYRMLHLAALDRAAAMDLIGGLLETSLELLSSGEVGRLLEQVWERTEGNPFFLRELVALLIEQKALRREGATWCADPEHADVQLPDTIQGALRAHLDRLPRDQRALIEGGAVLGRTFSVALLQQTLPTGSVGVGLEQLVQCGLLHRNAHGDLGFVQGLFQEVAYGSLLRGRRQELHAAAGQAMEALYAGSGDEHAHLMASHFVLAKDFERGVWYQYRAALRAHGLFELASARSAIEAALELVREHPGAPRPPSWELHFLHGQIMTSLGQLDVALASLSKAYAAVQDPQAKARVLGAHGDIYERQAAYGQALDAYERGLALLPPAADHERADMLSRLGYVKYRQGEYEQSMTLSRQAIEVKGEDPPSKEAGFAYTCIGLCYWRQGRYEAAVQHMHAARRHREAVHDLLGTATCFSNLANIYSDMGQMEEVEPFYDQSLQAYQKLGDLYWLSFGHNNLGSYLLTMGRLEQAEYHLNEAFMLQNRLQTKQLLAIVLFNLGEVRSLRGDPEQALQLMQHALSIFTAVDSQEVFPEVYRSMGRTCVELRRFAEARQYLELALRFAQGSDDLVTPGVVARIESMMTWAEGDHAQAHAHILRALGLLSEVDAPLELARAFALLARISPEPDERLRAQAEAAALCSRLGAQADLGQLDLLPMSEGSPSPGETGKAWFPSS